MVKLAAHAVAAPSSMRSPARRDDDDSLPPCWPPTITSAAPRHATAKPNSLRDVCRSWISVAKSAVASGMVVGMISALSDAGVRLRPTNARVLNPSTPHAAAAVIGRQRCSGIGVLVMAQATTSTAAAIAKRIVESSSAGTAVTPSFAAIHCPPSVMARMA